MRIANSRFLWVLVVVALLGLGAGSAFAGAPMETTCEFLDAKGSSAGFSLSVSPEGGEWPIWNSQFGMWEWRYTLLPSTGNYSRIARVTFTWPVCGTPLNFWEVNSTGDALTQIYPNAPGVGDDAYQFGWWDKTIYTAAVTPNPNSSPRRYSLFTDSILPAANIYMGMKSGNGTYSCKSIGGPACPDCAGLPFQPATITQCMEVEGNNIMLVRNTNRCITEVWKCEAADTTCSGYTSDPKTCTQLAPNVTVTVEPVAGSSAKLQDGITVGDILGNQICPEGILFSASSPGCSNVRTLSGWIQVCR